MGFIHATHEQVFGLASMMDFGHPTRHTRSHKSESSPRSQSREEM